MHTKDERDLNKSSGTNIKLSGMSDYGFGKSEKRVFAFEGSYFLH